MRRRILPVLALLGALAVSSYGQVPTPFITSIGPSSTIAGSPTFSLTVTGTGFQSVVVGSQILTISQVRWNGVIIPTTYLNSTQRVATVDASLVANPGTATVDVVNSSGPPSNALIFTILAPLVITTPSPLPPGTVGAGYIQQLTGVGGAQPYIGWYWSPATGSLPPGLSLDGKAGVISGIPSVAGTYSILVSLYDRYENFATKTFLLVINPPPVIATPSLGAMTVGAAFAQALTAAQGTPPYSNWRVVEGALPAGLALSSSGSITGTPKAAGSGAVQIYVDDSAGATASKVFDWLVNPAPLVITTSSPLPSGAVGATYFQTILATGGLGSRLWSIPSGTPPPGLTLSPGSGTITGTPTVPGAYRFTVQVTDSLGSATRTFDLTIASSGTTQGPDGQVGVSYSATLVALSGTPPWTWVINSGQLPPGLSLNGTTGVISGTPTTEGTFNFGAQWTDSQGLVFPNTFSIRILAAALAITTASPLPNATAAVAYSQSFEVTGGISPYTWSLQSGSLPSGLNLNATTGVLSGTPTVGGTFPFTVGVGDSSGGSTSKAFTLSVTVPAAPTVSVTGLTDTVSPAQQPTFDVQLSSTYSLPITGTITLTFTPDAVNPSDDPSIQFLPQGRTLSFNIPAGQTRAFPTSPPSIQTGTVAGRIDLTLSFLAGGQNITPTPAPVKSVTVPRSAPKVSSVQVVKVTGGFNVLVTGYSTPRQVTQAAFTFTAATGANLGTVQVPVAVDSAFTTWFAGTSSTAFGSSFLYTQPFTVQGSVSDIASVSVTLTNATGTSQPVSASF